MKLVKIIGLSFVAVLTTGCAGMQQKVADGFYNAKNSVDDPQEETVEVAVMNNGTQVGSSGDVFLIVYEGSEYTLIRKSAVGAVSCTVKTADGDVAISLKEKELVANLETPKPFGITKYTPHGSVNNTECVMML